MKRYCLIKLRTYNGYMKYLIILLFLFTNYSFSKDADNKGLDCNVEITDANNNFKKDMGKRDRIVLWFNNGKVEQARVNALMLEMGLGVDVSPKDRTLNHLEYKDSQYFANPDLLKWTTKLQYEEILLINDWKVDRKTLAISHSYITTNYSEWPKNASEEERKKLINIYIETGQCRVFTDFKVVEKYLEEKKYEIEKSMEKNKI